MALEFEEKQVFVAHRLGPYQDKARPLVVKLHPDLKQKVLNNKKILAKKLNADKKGYFINSQLPDQWVEERRERLEQIKQAKATAKEDKVEVDIEIKERKVYINKQPVKKFLHTPRPKDLFVDSYEQDKIDKLKLLNSDTLSEKGSSFTAYGLKCSSMTRGQKRICKVETAIP